MWILALPLYLSIPLAFLAAAGIALAPLVVSKPLRLYEATPDTRTLAQQAALRISVLHAMIMALAVSDLRAENSELLESVEREAQAVVQLSGLLGRLEVAEPARAELHAFVLNELDVVWPALEQGATVPPPSPHLYQLEDRLLELHQAHPEHELLFRRALERFDTIEASDIQQVLDVTERISPLVWVIIVLGSLLIIPTFYPYRLTWQRCTFVVLYAGLTGVVLLTMYAMSRPFVGSAGCTRSPSRWPRTRWGCAEAREPASARASPVCVLVAGARPRLRSLAAGGTP